MGRYWVANERCKDRESKEQRDARPATKTQSKLRRSVSTLGPPTGTHLWRCQIDLIDNGPEDLGSVHHN